MSEVNNVSEQTKHLESAVSQLKSLVNDINNLSNEVAAKREQALKLQGIVEYLRGLGVNLPEEGQESHDNTEVTN